MLKEMPITSFIAIASAKKKGRDGGRKHRKPKYTNIHHSNECCHRRYCKATVANTPMIAKLIPVVNLSAALVEPDEDPPVVPLLAV